MSLQGVKVDTSPMTQTSIGVIMEVEPKDGKQPNSPRWRWGNYAKRDWCWSSCEWGFFISVIISAEDLKTAVANYASASEIALDYQRGALIDAYYQKDDKGDRHSL